MIFEPLMESAERGELILVDGGFCHWHLRRDGQITIREIIVLPGQQRLGIGAAMLERIKRTPDATSIFAKCPADLPSNAWYAARGFTDEGTETTKSGRALRLWRMNL